MKNKIVTGMIATTLIFSLCAGQAFANGEDSPTEETNSEITLVEEATGAITTDVPAGEEAGSEDTVSEEVSADSEVIDLEEEEVLELGDPSLVPGDFFYFVKLMAEKVRLAFTFNDYEEAKLLAEIAAERISEANVLIADGKTAEAEELLKDAISTQEFAEETLAETEEETVTENSEETDGGETGAVTTNEAEDEETELESKLAHNIDSLLVVLGKIENPKAQQAIMKNIQKTFTKLDKRFTKLAEKEAKSTTEEKVTEGQISDEEASLEEPKLEEKATVVEATIIEVENETAEVTKVKEEKQQEVVKKAEEKKLKAPEKVEEKQQARANKAEVKQQQTASKAEEKGKN
ncbi:DUF5667 domain-containing protein [Neobacillus sp. 3P2-tot-E-2]|uniref:DUF5667 domain-containing protein n=1 Tax=Neobacillus sp. 3P2-tot-E-2 TaxID=3132212 RepID=UPI0039A0813C